MRWIDSEYEEIPGPHPGSVLRELYRVYRGRFCFRLGAGVRCGGGTSFTITEGETRTLELNLGVSLTAPVAPSAGVGWRCEHTHTFSQQIGPWPLKACDSIFPVLCFDDAELRIYRFRRPILRYELSAFKERFDPHGDLGWAHPNTVENDPLCECHDPESPTVVDAAPTPTQETVPCITIVRVTAFLPAAASDGQREDPGEAAQETAAAIAEILDTDEEPPVSGAALTGIARSDGVVIWLDEAAQSGAPSLALLPWGMSSLSRRLMTFDRSLTPVVAVGPPTDAASCDVRILVQRPGEDALQELVRDQAAVKTADRFTVAWYETDFSELPGETSGFIELELRDAAGGAVGYPVREPFVIDPLLAPRARARMGV